MGTLPGVIQIPTLLKPDVNLEVIGEVSLIFTTEILQLALLLPKVSIWKLNVKGNLDFVTGKLTIGTPLHEARLNLDVKAFK